MRKKIVAGNWKMNNDLVQSEALIAELLTKLPQTTAEVMIAPTFVNLATAVQKTKASKVEVIAQNMHFAENGAYTGEISAQMLASIGVKTTILGHSERREYFNETDEALTKKVDTALKHKMRVVFCIGEKLAERKANKHFDVVKEQIEKALFHLSAQAWQSVILAYEPVWAIGTGETATPEQAQEMHAFIRKIIADKYGNEVAQNVSILYGGSANPKNAKDIFAQKDVDGGLIGGASLKADDFVAVISAI
ncbi:triose-phosphate isomerase [Capnocytophaga catalasegens]|uniref:Triosephosphate isomerase n=1 Tax=Capnocytophaga catalasegens TaxID=1004260 RepID=A0AAV5AQR2_9FLAO|nr:triose-phosphate isomerase [Capnocytophaga catalasegens]GIZ15116.1 triosephosphate isomerase [Capnocytophaga catalasegens]GJM49631.1 triosephosphate isomerase [Capnocytophaga catalasegens]GJM52696.1 triosephosphate isomerase [Capnocytophaga catalasegens]